MGGVGGGGTQASAFLTGMTNHIEKNMADERACDEATVVR